jgi:hypothetical protein
MPILLLEDEYDRARTIQKALGANSGCVHVTNAPEAIVRLGPKYTWDLVMLDHDLGKTKEVRKTAGTGMDVVDWFVAQKDEDRADVEVFLIHSFNNPRACEMFHRLRDAGLYVRQDALCAGDALKKGVTIQKLIGLDWD